MIGVIGDTHFKDNLSYADHISDLRITEKKEILDFIIESFKDCNHIVFLGDLFNAKNNSSETNRQVIEFLERFGKKNLYIISGNHEKKGDGKTAIDFIKEIEKENWHIFTKPESIIIEGKKIDFLPYMLSSELEVNTFEESTKKIIKQLPGGDILFAHHAITGTSFNGIKTDMLKEVVLPKDKLEKKYELVCAGHIHAAQQYDKILITGALFTSEVGEIETFIYKINDKLEIEKIKTPSREIHKLKDPTTEQFSNIPKGSIIKVIVTDKSTDIETLQKQLKKFDASLMIEDYPNERKKSNIEKGGAFDFSLEALLKLYAREKEVSYQKLLKGLELINE